MSYTTPQSVDVAGEVYSSLMPADENEMIYDAAKNPELGRKYLKKFASETSPNLPGVQQCLAQVRAGLDANEKFQAQAAPASK